jgi:hypothetical protein
MEDSRRILQQGKEILYVEEWEQFATEWRKEATISRCSGG